MSVFHQTQRAGSFPGRCSRWERIRLGLRSLRRCDGRRAEIDRGDAGQALGLLSFLPEEGPLMVIHDYHLKNSAPAPLNNWRWLSPRSPGPTYRYTGQAPTAAAKPPTTGRSTGPRPRHRGRGLAASATQRTAVRRTRRKTAHPRHPAIPAARRFGSPATRQPPTRRPGHSLRHTFATELAKSDVSVYTLMNLLGHDSMATSQRYVTAAGTATRTAAAANPLYRLLNDRNAGATD